MEEQLSIIHDKLCDALDEVATAQAVAKTVVVRSAKQPPSKKRYDAEHYATAGAKLTRAEYMRLRHIADGRGVTVSRLIGDHIRSLIVTGC